MLEREMDDAIRVRGRLSQPVEIIKVTSAHRRAERGHGRRGSVRSRAVIAANSELQERELLKRARLAAAMADALRARGADDTTARLAAEIGVLAFSTAYTRWAAPEDRQPFSEIAHAALADLQARATTLGADADVRA